MLESLPYISQVLIQSRSVVIHFQILYNTYPVPVPWLSVCPALPIVTHFYPNNKTDPAALFVDWCHQV